MDIATNAPQWLAESGYWIMFLLMLVEGPVVTAAGAFGAVLGYFNLWLVFFLSVLGNLLPDAAYYLLGFWGRERLIDKYRKYLRLPMEKINRLEQLYHEHVGKTLIAVKLLPFAATPGLIVAGIARVPLKKYIWWSIVVTLPSSLLFLLVGYWAGSAYSRIVRYIDYGGYVLVAIIAIFVLSSYIYKKFSRKIAERVEKI